MVSSDRDLLVLRAYDGICFVNPGEFLVVLRLVALSPLEMRTVFSPDALLKVWSSICLKSSLKDKVAEALSGLDQR